jgi:hypothetical protein
MAEQLHQFAAPGHGGDGIAIGDRLAVDGDIRRYARKARIAAQRVAESCFQSVFEKLTGDSVMQNQ